MNKFFKELIKKYPEIRFEIFKKNRVSIITYNNLNLVNDNDFKESIVELAELYLDDISRNSLSICYEEWYKIQKAL